MPYPTVEDLDSDSGDISLSLSFPSSVSLPTVSRSNGPSSRDYLPSPAPQRLFNKSLLGRSSPRPASGTSESASIPSPSPFSHPTSSTNIDSTSPNTPAPTVSLDRDDLTPSASSSFWGIDTPVRPSSASISTSTRHLHPDPDSILTPRRPALNQRRITSAQSLTRSRSLNARIPPSDLSLLNATSAPATSKMDPSDYLSPIPAPAVPSPRTPSMRIGWSRRPGEARPPPLLDDGVATRMGRWVKEVVVCNFDLERGPVVERRAGGRRWGPGEKENVAFSSFPDTSLFAEGSIMFSFKIRHIPPDPASLAYPEPPSPMPDRASPRFPSVEQTLMANSVQSPRMGAKGPVGSPIAEKTPNPVPPSQMGTGDKADEYRKWDERGREWLYGFVWFEQRRDKGIARGYMQKSVVLLTHLPFPALFFAVLERVAPAFFRHGYSALEVACQTMASWPDPTPDTLLELPLMLDVLTVRLPDTTETAQSGVAFRLPSPEHPILASLPRSTPLGAFHTFLPSLWSLWECLLLAEPVLVIAPDPRTCSEIVWWLRDMLRPIPPAGDFRPYLHIHDHDFSLLVNSNKPQAGVVVGVTNPFFRNAASHWPNVIAIPSDHSRRRAPSGISPSPSPRPDQPEGFLSRRHRSVQKERTLLKRLEALTAEGKLDDPEASEALRTHFQQLTEKMLVPLNRYFQTLVPTLSPGPGATTASATLRPFSLPGFLAHLRTHGPNPLAFRTRGLSTKSRVESDFYASFCMSPSFAGWLSARIESLGIAVAAQTSTLIVPTSLYTPIKPSLPGNKSSVGLGMGISNPLAFCEGRFPVPFAESIATDSDATRPSSEDGSFTGAWRASEDSPRAVGGPIGESYFFGRRGSEGGLLALQPMSSSPKRK